MAETDWKYVENQFDNCSKRNKKRMEKISSDHASKLEAESSDPVILEIHTRFAPVRTVYRDSYGAAVTANAIYKSKTAAFVALEKELSSIKIEDWDVQVQVVYRKDSPNYIGILPRGREPFQKGTYDQKITEVRELGIRLEGHPALATTKTAVDAFAASFEEARNEQQQKEDIVKLKSDMLESARVTTARMMYGNLGVLMDKYRDDPKQIERFFDLEEIRNTGSESYVPLEGSIAGGDSKCIEEGITNPNKEWVFANLGVATIIYFTAPTPDAVFTDYGQKVNPGETYTKKAIDLGPEGYQFLIVTNLDPDNEGYYSVTEL